MIKDDVIAICANGQKFLAPDALEYILSTDKPIDFINTVLKHTIKEKMFLTKQDVIDAITGDAIVEPEKTIVPKNKFTSDISIVKSSDVTGNSTATGTVEEFANYIKNRYINLSRIIESHASFGKSMTFASSKKYDRDELKVIGIVYSAKTTKNGHIMLQVEDISGMYNVMILKSSPFAEETYIEDEVIGFVGRWNAEKTLFMVKRVVRPDVPRTNKWEQIGTDSKVMFLSDIHMGSKTFIQEDWDRAIGWLKENAINENINYMVLPGDVVDGIGVFPDQDLELDELDIYKQYEMLGEALKDIPDHIKMVLHPGNHDACRLAEPQPALNSIFTKTFDSNIILTGNPIYINIEGKTILSYHGKSMDDWVAKVKGLSYDRPNDIMKQMCIRRHLAPVYGAKNALMPEEKDYLAINTVPDCIVTGHIHKASLGIYNGVRLINASTFQDQTNYQKMHNFVPTPGRVPILNLSTGGISMHDFHKV